MSRLPPNFLKAIVALGSSQNPEGEVFWTATGFFYGYIPPGETDKGYPYLVTNRHVLDGVETLYLRLNPTLEDCRARIFACPLLDKRGKPLWFGHPKASIDLAVLPFDFGLLSLKEGVTGLILNSQLNAYHLKQLKDRVWEGDDVFILGFPLGTVGAFRNAPVVRRGCIAQIQELYSGHSPSFLVDAEVFPGNSGGPVILAPETVTPCDSPPRKPALVGVAFAYLAYQDLATSDQTGHPRVIFEENTGLTEVYPVDRVDETIRAHLKPARKKPAKKAGEKARKPTGKPKKAGGPRKPR